MHNHPRFGTAELGRGRSLLRHHHRRCARGNGPVLSVWNAVRVL